jgi:hypothetical protein
MGQSSSQPAPSPSEPLSEAKLAHEHVDLVSREQSEQKRIAGLIAELETTTVKMREEMPCQEAQKATLECYKAQTNGVQILDCSNLVDAYLHCTATSKR